MDSGSPASSKFPILDNSPFKPRTYGSSADSESGLSYRTAGEPSSVAATPAWSVKRLPQPGISNLRVSSFILLDPFVTYNDLDRKGAALYGGRASLDTPPLAVPERFQNTPLMSVEAPFSAATGLPPPSQETGKLWETKEVRCSLFEASQELTFPCYRIVKSLIPVHLVPQLLLQPRRYRLPRNGVGSAAHLEPRPSSRCRPSRHQLRYSRRRMLRRPGMGAFVAI